MSTDSIFKGLVRDPRDVQAPEGSTNAALLALPQQREHTHDMKGRVLLLPRTGLIVVPYRMERRSWGCVVVDGSACRYEDGRESYPRGGHDIDVSNLEMQTAIELPVQKPSVPAEGTVGYITLRFPISIETDPGNLECPPEQYLYAGDPEVLEHTIPADIEPWLRQELIDGGVFIDFTPGAIDKHFKEQTA